MTVYEFRHPDFIHVHRRCRKCGETVLVTLGFGADVPRDPYFTCAFCHETPEATQERVLALVLPQPQLDLGDEAA